jgi:hypothetical protein
MKKVWRNYRNDEWYLERQVKETILLGGSIPELQKNMRRLEEMRENE